jgi:chloramphenicol 3-O phosphotransferase
MTASVPADGTIIVLSGPSCTGKTTIARDLQSRLLPRPYLHVGLDYFEAMQPRRDGRRVHVVYGRAPECALRGPDLLPVVHGCAAAFAREGAGVVLEHIFFRRRWLKDAVQQFAGLPVLFVGLVCPADELTRREQARTTRNAGPGQAARQVRMLETLDAHAPYDLLLDTLAASPAECVEAIQRRLEEGPGLAFTRLLGSPLLDEPDPVIS